MCFPGMSAWSPAERVVQRLGRVIHPTRWAQVHRALRQLVHLHESRKGSTSTERGELRRLISTRLFEVAEGVDSTPVTEVKQAHQKLRSQLNRHVTEDVLRSWMAAAEPSSLVAGTRRSGRPR